jgi:hypothetical protein
MIMPRNIDYGEVTTAFRTAIEDRATWFYFLLKAAEEETFGVNKGKMLGDIKTPKDFVDALACGYVEKAFDMEKVEANDEKGVLRFHYCALVESWKKLGCTTKEVSKLCKLARYGDYGIVSNFKNLQLDFAKLLADGDDFCELVVTRKG